MKLSLRNKYIIPIVLVCCISVSWLFFKNGKTKKVTIWPTKGRPVKIEPVKSASASAMRAFPGVAQAVREATLAFRVGGPLRKLPVDVGQYIQEGELIAQIDRRDFDVRVKALTARLEAYRAQHVDAELQFTRYTKLYAKNAVPKAEFDHVKATFDRISAQVEATRQELQAARNALEDTSLRAPFSGYVHRKFVENYDFVKETQPIVLFLDCSVIEVTAGIPEEMVADDIHLERFSCTFDTYPGIRLEAHLKELGRKPRASNQTYPLTVTLTPPESLQVRPGMASTVHISFTSRTSKPCVLVPVSAVVNDRENRSWVWQYNNSTATVDRQAVKTGRLTEEGLEVYGDLQEGMLVVSAGAHFLQPGQKVTVHNTDWMQKQHADRAGDE